MRGVPHYLSARKMITQSGQLLFSFTLMYFSRAAIERIILMPMISACRSTPRRRPVSAFRRRRRSTLVTHDTAHMVRHYLRDTAAFI